MIVPLCKECSVLAGLEFAVGIRLADDRINVRPTFGMLVAPAGYSWAVGSASPL